MSENTTFAATAPAPAPRKRGRPSNAERAARLATSAMERGVSTAEVAAAPRAPRGTMAVGNPGEAGREESGAEEAPDEGVPEVAEGFWTPGREVFINLKGKLYLPARRRVQWMRGEPVPHPEWTIDTDIVEHEQGKFIRPGRVEGGHATLRADIFNEAGRLIATGLKTEYSENFADYLEKAETGAIARALAIAGYGTETALDLDEGLDKERIADSPVAAPGMSPAGVPAGVGPSAVSGIGKGGRLAGASSPQIARIAELSRELGLGRDELLTIVGGITGFTTPALSEDPSEAGLEMTRFLRTLPGEQIGKVVDALQKTLDQK